MDVFGKGKILIFIIVALVVLVSGGILAYQLWWTQNKEAETKFLLDETFDKIKNINSLKYEISELNNKGKIFNSEKVWRKGRGSESKVRVEIEGSWMPIQIWDFGKNLWYTYLNENSFKEAAITKDSIKLPVTEFAIEGTGRELLDEIGMIKGGNPVVIGSEVLDGKETLVVEAFDERTETKVKSWIWKDYGIVIKVKNDEEKYEFRRENIEVNIDIPDDVFELPPEAKIVIE